MSVDREPSKEPVNSNQGIPKEVFMAAGLVALAGAALVAGKVSGYVDMPKDSVPYEITVNEQELLVMPTKAEELPDMTINARATTVMLDQTDSHDLTLPIVIPNRIEAGYEPGQGAYLNIDGVEVGTVNFQFPEYGMTSVSTDVDITLKNCSTGSEVVEPVDAKKGLTVQDVLPGREGGLSVPRSFSYIDEQKHVVNCNGYSVGEIDFPQDGMAKFIETFEDFGLGSLPGLPEREQPQTVLNFSIPG